MNAEQAKMVTLNNKPSLKQILDAIEKEAKKGRSDLRLYHYNEKTKKYDRSFFYDDEVIKCLKILGYTVKLSEPILNVVLWNQDPGEFHIISW